MTYKLKSLSGGLGMLKLTNRIELFVDDFLIEDMGKAFLKLNHPTKRETVWKIEKPWECPSSGVYANVFYDGEKIRLYYRGYPSVTSNDYDKLLVNCLAVSYDGVDFERPDLGIIEYNGNKHNNIVFIGSLAHNFSPFWDSNPDCPDDERFKAICGFANTGLFLYISENGLNWKKAQEEPIIKNGCFDSLNIMFYDNLNKKYRCYYRYFDNAKGTLNEFSGIHAIASCSSADFKNWSE